MEEVEGKGAKLEKKITKDVKHEQRETITLLHFFQEIHKILEVLERELNGLKARGGELLLLKILNRSKNMRIP